MRKKALTPQDEVIETLEAQQLTTMEDAEQMTALDAVDLIVQHSRECMLHKVFFEKNVNVLKRIGSILGISEEEALMLSVCTEFSRGIDSGDVSDYFNCSAARALAYVDVLDNMAKKGLLIKREGMREDGFVVSKEAKEALRSNQKFVSKLDHKLDIFEFVDVVNREIKFIMRGRDDFDEGITKLREVVDANTQLVLAGEVSNMALSDEDLFAILFMCMAVVTVGQTSVKLGAITGCFDNFFGMRTVEDDFRKSKHRFMKEGLVEFECADGTSDADTVSLTEKAFKLLLPEYNVEEVIMKRNSSGLVHHADLVEKKLFFNDAEHQQLSRLSELLSQENFKGVQQRLKDRGFREGVCILFYGSPGTGKTESVKQLARLTGRDIVEVNVSDFKSKFVGESESQLRDIFRSYRNKVRSLKVCPILLFNEADAILGIRQEGASKAVDKMENSLQNILLQEFENLNGIVIATTNLTANLDSAFERRFLFKIEFNKPNKEVKKQIWSSMLPDLNDEQSAKLADQFDFSPGQIENVARKQMVNTILTGDAFDFNVVYADCQQENIKGGNTHSRVGFTA